MFFYNISFHKVYTSSFCYVVKGHYFQNNAPLNYFEFGYIFIYTYILLLLLLSDLGNAKVIVEAMLLNETITPLLT